MKAHCLRLRPLAALAVVALLSACGGGGSGDATTQAAAVGSGSTDKATISGQPTGSVAVGQAYDFKPTAAVTSGGTLTFSAANLPSWLTLNAQTGEISGTPAAGNVGAYSNIMLSVSDGTATASLTAFTITVTQIATGSATVSWTPPTANSDGSTLSNLNGYVLLYGQSSGNLDHSVSVSGSLTTYVVDNLSPGTWYFSLVTVNSQDIQSIPTNLASTTL